MKRDKIYFGMSVGILVVFMIAGICPSVHAGPGAGPLIRCPDKALTRIFMKDRVSIQWVGGALWSPFLKNNHWSDLDYYQTNLRVGIMLTDPIDPNYFIKGNIEGVLEATYSDINEGSGSFLYGGTVLFRYNVLSLDNAVVPYIQGGAGIVYNDIYKDRTQSVVGQSIEFSLRGSVGVRYLFIDSWTLDLEAVFEHVSCAGMSDRNGGINAGGAFVGVTYFFCDR